MDAVFLAATAGMVLSLGFEYIPGLHDRYNALADAKQKLVMLAVLGLTAGGIFAWACVGVFQQVSCDQPGALALLSYFVVAAIANQTTHRLSP